MAQPTVIELFAAILFGLAILHTFATKFFERLAHRYPNHEGIFHLLGEVEVVFGFWALIFMLGLFLLAGKASAVNYIDSRNFTEPLFVFAIMVVAGTKPILQLAAQAVNLSSQLLAQLIRLPATMTYLWMTLTAVPLLGSLITEPAAMTLAALILRDRYFANGMSSRFLYATLAVLFVNISIGGTLTHFAAPPVLMVAAKWQWDTLFMFTQFGWKAALAVVVNSTLLTLFFSRELSQLAVRAGLTPATANPIPITLTLTHLLFLSGVVFFAHHPAIFMGLLLFFLGVTHAYARYQSPLILKEGLLVAFFLAGLVVLGGQQQWWLQPLLLSMSSDAVFMGATALTAITDNAALTYLGSLVEGLSTEFKYALVAGAVTGGGLTIIANAPNPAGVAILREHFSEKAVNPLALLLFALPPTVIAGLAFKYL
ncbi:putative Na+/H+ antiporter [Parvibium lacunae]|uniref:Na+/H+ antiporter n=1 Tax=Parvibium lacunae TaxID=1888893 RepID=A0A368L7K5_9BURK|nr:putative Na+/H+ antiporter [Parvibium lacunae]RCS59650.1 hypothetical protein DU000_02775 [Parvibium lacunae]